jgi:hypothetical protein
MASSIALSLHTIPAEIDAGRLAILEVAGLAEIRQWFVAHVSEHPEA